MSLPSCRFPTAYHKLNEPKLTDAPMASTTTKHRTMLSPATAALEQFNDRIGQDEAVPAKVDFDMTSLFNQAIVLDSTAFPSFPSIDWSFDSDSSDTDYEVIKKTNGQKSVKKFEELFKCHRREMRSKHLQPNRMVRSKAQYGELSRLEGSTSSLRSLQSFAGLSRSS
jgi:hypothetical protein